MTHNLFCIYICLCIIISIIIYKYYKNTHLDIELFETMNDMNDSILQNAIKDLQLAMDRYSYLDTPIIINNTGNICMQWSDKYKSNENNCIVPDDTNGNERKCLNTDGTLSSCSNMYSDGYIEKKNTIDIIPLIEETKNAVLADIKNINSNIREKIVEIDKLINNVVIERNLEIQQKQLIDNINNTLELQKNNIKKINKNVLDKQTNLNIDQTTFSQFNKNYNTTDKRNKLYYKITFILIICIIIMILFNILFSNIL